jgi:Mn-dependent DtxR family transcriptional regulator
MVEQGGVKKMSEEVTEELKKKILNYLETVSKAKNKDVARAIGVEKSLTDKAIGQLGKEGKIEYLYLGTSFIKLKGKEE